MIHRFCLAGALLIASQPACDSGPPRRPSTTSPAGPGSSQPARDHSASPTKADSFDIGANANARALTPLSEFEGRMRRVVIHAPHDLVAKMWTPIRDLLRSTGPSTRFTFVCNSDAASAELSGKIADAGLQMRAHVQIRRVRLPMRIWARDRYIASAAPKADSSVLPIWLVPQLVLTFDEASRAGERKIPNALNSFEPICRIAETPIVLEGGNVLAAGRHVFIGANVIAENAATFVKESLLSTLSSTFKPRVLLIADDTGRPPAPHIDMYITVVGNDNILVGSPRLAADVMKNADEPSRRALAERLYITPDMPDPKGPDFTPQRIARFDQVAAYLERAGYRVTRIPYVDCRNGDFIVTYNNVLQETHSGRHTIYMPIYKVPALDAAARMAYESLGFEVKPIDISPICHLLGAIRCMANVVEREE